MPRQRVAEDDEYDNPADRLPPPFRPDMPEMSKGLERRDMMRRQPMPSESRNLDGDIQAMEDSIRDAYQQPIENRPTKNWFHKLGRGFNKFGRSYRSGKGIVGAVSDTLDPTYDERMNRQDQINQMFGQYANLRKMQEAEQAEQRRTIDIENIKADNLRADEQMEWDREYRIGLRQDKAQSDLFKSPYFDPNNPVHVQQAIAAKLDPKTLVGWDYRNPNVRKIGGIEYQFNRANGTWAKIGVDSNNLRPYTVRKEDGTTETFMIPESDAAKFADQMARLRMTVQARSDLADKNIAAQRQGREFTEAQKNARAAAYNQLREALDAARRNPNDPKAKQKVADIRKQIQDDPALQ